MPAPTSLSTYLRWYEENLATTPEPEERPVSISIAAYLEWCEPTRAPAPELEEPKSEEKEPEEQPEEQLEQHPALLHPSPPVPFTPYPFVPYPLPPEPLSPDPLPPSDLERYRLSHSGTCRLSDCDQEFTSVADFVAHVETVHVPKGTPDVNVLDQWDSYQETEGRVLENHSMAKQMLEPEPSPFLLCQWGGCSDQLNNRRALLRHVMAHLLKYGCRMCDKNWRFGRDAVTRHYRRARGHPNCKAKRNCSLEKYAYMYFVANVGENKWRVEMSGQKKKIWQAESSRKDKKRRLDKEELQVIIMKQECERQLEREDRGRESEKYNMEDGLRLSETDRNAMTEDRGGESEKENMTHGLSETDRNAMAEDRGGESEKENMEHRLSEPDREAMVEDCGGGKRERKHRTWVERD